jgi:hypothetical protein
MQPIPLSLTPDQAVVLLGLLASSRLTSEHTSEQRLLWEIEAQLERQVLEHMQPDKAA